MKRPEDMTMTEAREYCLRLERYRERSWRKTNQGKFEFGFSSFDELVAGSADPSKLPALSDGGKGVERIVSHGDLADDEACLERLPPKDRDFVKAVLSGKTWRQMRIPKRTFNYRLEKIRKNLRHS